MDPKLGRKVGVNLQPELDALTEAHGEFLARFPSGPEAGIERYRDWLRVELTYTSNAIEGSTLSARETAMVIGEDAVIPNKSLREHLEARDHAIAFDYAMNVLKPMPQLEASDLLALHERILYSTNHTEAGVLRRDRIRVAGSNTVFPNPVKVPELFDRLIEDMNQPPRDIHPVIHAAMAHLDFVKIHPIIDGNGRTARLLMNLMLERANYASIPIYPEDRSEYLGALELADQDGGADFYRHILTWETRSIQELLRDA
jgi:Fic family protein